MTLYVVILAAWLLAGALGYRFLKQNPGYKFTGGRAVLYAVMAVGLAVRLVLAARDYAFAVDINCFKAWAECTAYYGLNGMYHSGVFLDYPPGYMYVLALTKLIQSVFAIEYDSALYTLIIKLPSIIADIAGTAFVQLSNYRRFFIGFCTDADGILYLCHDFSAPFFILQQFLYIFHSQLIQKRIQRIFSFIAQTGKTSQT